MTDTPDLHKSDSQKLDSQKPVSQKTVPQGTVSQKIASPQSAESAQLSPAQVQRNRWKLIGILVVFVLPVFFAYAGYFGGWFQHYTRSNRGELLQPGTQISNWQWQFADGREFATEGKWWLVYVHANPVLADPALADAVQASSVAGGAICDDRCQLQLYTMQQTWIGIGKEQDRVRMAVLGDIGSTALPEQAKALWADPQALKRHGVTAPAYYIIDPLGNVVLRYLAPGQKQDAIERSKDIRKDFQKLLRFSHIG